MNTQAPENVTQLLQEWNQGSQAARDRLLTLVYDELRRLAHRYLQRERGVQTLQTTALVNEVYLRLFDASVDHCPIDSPSFVFNNVALAPAAQPSVSLTKWTERSSLVVPLVCWFHTIELWARATPRLSTDGV